ncbi:SGNH/GDSL hydrolase family protein [Paenibacillus senegalensis]|uniref:SGNH/GDSL hydrolase family protein n=1 Tax=Paenibacillus senegalensis TaxID=1465766 RepID=UPI0002893D64|nr:SGNH/GDSL hydrolase family protein [Paenibacillus senegalensis]
MSESTQRMDIQKLDRNMAVPQQGGSALKWLSPFLAPVEQLGFAWLEQDKKYRRLPVKPAVPLPPAVDVLANCTAGGQIRFRTNSSRLSIRVRLRDPADMYHMAPTGQCGFDCYLGDPGARYFLTTARLNPREREYEAAFYDWQRQQEEEVTLYFPLYQAVESVWIGIDSDAELFSPAPLASYKPVIIYGTSITQGGCASRPGMAYPNILSRQLPLPFINLGFSGNGKGEPELAEVISTIEDPALLVLDYEANVGTVEDMARTFPEFIRIVRSNHPKLPILAISNIEYAGIRFNREIAQLHEARRKVQMDTIQSLREAGDMHLHFVDGYCLLGEDASECTVDGVHPTDLGFWKMAQALHPILLKILEPLIKTA